MKFSLPLITAMLLATTPAWGISHTETGDFSDNGLSPNAFVLDPGINVISARVGFHPDETVDRDYFSLTVPGGYVLSSLVLGSGTVVGGGASFVGVQAGPVMTVDPLSGSPEGLLGWAHYGSAFLGTDILGFMGFGPGSTGYTPPLAAGTYTFWVQDYSAALIPYVYEFGVTPVPEPGVVWLMLAGGILLGLSRLKSAD
ncbi:MAG: PEP-CTERM sorting domain-containing protein [Betaproteobacteria bacterium]